MECAGPTATGKSSIALEVCKELGGEIVSCDSVQVYKELSIGCNKPSEQDMQGVRHHLVDVAALSETFTAGTQVFFSKMVRIDMQCPEWRALLALQAFFL